MSKVRIVAGAALLCIAATSFATILGNVRGLIHDPHHRPVGAAEITLKAVGSDWTRTTKSNDRGEFLLGAVPLGRYTVSVSVPGFSAPVQEISLSSGNLVQVHFQLEVEAVHQTVDVFETGDTVATRTVTTATTLSRQEIQQTPGATRTNSLAMITDYVPSAYVVHDQLHLRGGHQMSWLLDGVPVPNTNIASNVGPQFDPKDIDTIEVQRGGLSAEYGDRTYGVLNVVTRSGFERNREGELVLSYGSFHSTDDQISFGSHTQRFAWYTSLSGNRSDLGLETPSTTILNDQVAGLSAFTSLIFNATPNDQLRVVSSIRGDHYQVPNTPEQQASGTRDVENERDALVNFSWVHTLRDGWLFTVAPFYHFNRAHYLGGFADLPVSPESDRGSNYGGGVLSLNVLTRHHSAHVGGQAFAQRDNTLFAIQPNDGSGLPVSQRQMLWGDVEAVFLEDQYKPTSWLTLTAGLRMTRFSGDLSETAADPRAGAAIRIPRLKWTLHGFYGRYYQAPPLLTVSGPLLDVAAAEGFAFLPLHGEKDEQYEAGLAVPMAGWSLDLNYFHTAARNFFDHDVLGNSNIFFPLTIERARIRGWDATLRSPRIAGFAQFHLAFARQYAQGKGGVTGGLTDFSPPEDVLFFLDHDQRNTLSTGAHLDLPWHSWASVNLAYGSGFLDGNGPGHLPSHTTADLTLGKSIGERWAVGFTALNLTNHRYLLDNSNTFGGTHYVNPRELMVEVKYRFRF